MTKSKQTPKARRKSDLKIVKRLQRRKYDPAIIERTICLEPSPFTAL